MPSTPPLPLCRAVPTPRLLMCIFQGATANLHDTAPPARASDGKYMGVIASAPVDHSCAHPCMA
eukprot:153047-Chlamydomonas_euryale.AAC.6